MLPRLLAAIALLLASPSAVASAQTYARSAHDTLRFHELTTAAVTVTTPQGELPITIDHDATIGVLLLPGNAARAWYESLWLARTGPTGTATPETEGALRKPFTLRVDARGRVTVREAPRFPASFETITDLTHQFDDFFLRLPAEPLRVGLVWSDTVIRTDSSNGKTMRSHTVGTYRVERDTIVAGEPAFVISSSQQLRSETSGPVAGQAMRARSTLAGSDEGSFVFAKSGHLLGRQRTGALRGELTMSGARGTTTMAQTYRYTNRVDALRPPGVLE